MVDVMLCPVVFRTIISVSQPAGMIQGKGPNQSCLKRAETIRYVLLEASGTVEVVGRKEATWLKLQQDRARIVGHFHMALSKIQPGPTWKVRDSQVRSRGVHQVQCILSGLKRVLLSLSELQIAHAGQAASF